MGLKTIYSNIKFFIFQLICILAKMAINQSCILRWGLLNAASVKITVFKIKSQFTEYSSVISSLTIILTETCIFSKISNQCKFYKNKKIFAYFQHAFHIQLIVDTYFIVILNCF